MDKYQCMTTNKDEWNDALVVLVSCLFGQSFFLQREKWVRLLPTALSLAIFMFFAQLTIIMRQMRL